MSPTPMDSADRVHHEPAPESAADPGITTPSKTFPSNAQIQPVSTNLPALIALNLSVFLVALDTVLIPTALPTISRTFDISDSLYAWIGSAYLLANAASVPFWGNVSNIFGQRPIIITANVIFLLGSIICAASVNGPTLVAGRAVQGLGGGGVVVLVHVCVSDMYPIRDRSFYIGIIGTLWAVASAFGPVLGGVFAERLDWRCCFYINLPVVSCATIVLYFKLHLDVWRKSFFTGLASVDWLGTSTILIATIFLLVGLQIGGTGSYNSPMVVASLVIGSLAYVAFPITQWWKSRQGGNPIMPLRIFKDLSNLSALGVCACDGLVFNSITYFLPLYFQIVLGLSPSTAGLYMLAIAIPLAVVSLASGHVIEKTGCFLEVLQAGLLLMAIGAGLLISLSSAQDPFRIIGFLVVLGLGFGPNFGAPLIALQTRVQECDIATGTAAFGFVRMVSGAIGVVIGQVVFQLLMKLHFQSFVDQGISQELTEKLDRGDAISRSVALVRLHDAQKMVVRVGLNDALRGTWVINTVISGLGLLISFGIKRTRLHRDQVLTEMESASNRPVVSHE